jgi:CheY-like chemotaxis protein
MSDNQYNMPLTETKPPSQRILVVDDEPFVCESVRLMLSYDGHAVETACSGKDALAKYDAERFDLVITDYKMEGMKGDQLAQAIKERAPNKPIILLTAFAPMEKPAAIDLVLGKPFYVETLREALLEMRLWGARHASKGSTGES